MTSGIELLQRAELLLNSGLSDAAAEVLDEALQCGQYISAVTKYDAAVMDKERQIARAARYTLSLLQLCSHDNLTKGKGKASSDHMGKVADDHLRSLGFRFRLAREAFRGGAPILADTPRSIAFSPPKHAVQVIDNAIPMQWVNHLREAFSPDSSFWYDFHCCYCS